MLSKKSSLPVCTLIAKAAGDAKAAAKKNVQANVWTSFMKPPCRVGAPVRVDSLCGCQSHQARRCMYDDAIRPGKHRRPREAVAWNAFHNGIDESDGSLD